MSDNEKKETIADKAKEGFASATAAAKEQFDALKTKEGREELKNKAKRLWCSTGIIQRVVVLVAVVLVTIFLTRSCGSSVPVTGDTQQGNPKQDGKEASKLVDSVDLTKADDKTGSLKSFLEFTFGTGADEFEDVKDVYVTNETVKGPHTYDTYGLKGEELEKVKREANAKHHSLYYTTTVKLKEKFRLFDSATLKFTRKDKRLYYIEIKTSVGALAEFKPTSILREVQYCAAIIENKYGSRFRKRTSTLFDEKEEKGGYSSVAATIGSNLYVNENEDSTYMIAPYASYHGFFNNAIEIRCCLTGGSEENRKFVGDLGIKITAMDHSVIEEDGGRTKVINFDADDDEGKL